MRLLSQSRRLRQTPFSEGVEDKGVTAYTVYNRMLLPTVQAYRHPLILGFQESKVSPQTSRRCFYVWQYSGRSE